MSLGLRALYAAGLVITFWMGRLFDPVLVAFAVQHAGLVAVGAVEAEGFGEEDVSLFECFGFFVLERLDSCA